MQLVNPDTWLAVRNSPFVWDRQNAELADVWAHLLEDAIAQGKEFSEEIVWGSFERSAAQVSGPRCYRTALRLLAAHWVQGEELLDWVEAATAGRIGQIRDGIFHPRSAPSPEPFVVRRGEKSYFFV